jgi:hypothetical protein
MKPNALLVLSLLAAIAALALAPVAAAAAGIIYTAAGVIAMLLGDYGWKREPVRVRAEMVAFEGPGGEAPGLDRAA